MDRHATDGGRFMSPCGPCWLRDSGVAAESTILRHRGHQHGSQTLLHVDTDLAYSTAGGRKRHRLRGRRPECRGARPPGVAAKSYRLSALESDSEIRGGNLNDLEQRLVALENSSLGANQLEAVEAPWNYSTNGPCT